MNILSTRRLAAICLAASLLTLGSAVHAQQVTYSNVTNFTGQVDTNGGVTSDTGTRQTILIADDLTYDPALALTNVTQFRFTLANLNSTSQAIMASVRFYNSNGANGGPGTLITGFNFNAVTVGASSVTTLTFNVPAASQFLLPSSGTMWAGVYFSSGTQTAAVLNNFGQGIYNPPTIGSSADRAFYSSTTGTFTTSNPAGTIQNSPYGGTPVANFGWQFTTAPIPEPSTVAFAFVGAGLLVATRLKRRR